MIAEMILGYSELEYRMFMITSIVKPEDTEAYDLFFSIDGEAQRIKLFSILCKKYVERLGYGESFSDLIGAIKHCKKIRNQYAHKAWSHINDRLALMNYKKNNSGIVSKIEYFHTSTEIISDQYKYFTLTVLKATHLNETLKAHPAAAPIIELPNFPEKPRLFERTTEV